MKLTFIGAAHEVTGSCSLIEVGNIKGLVDCGMEQGKDLYENVELPVKAGDIDFVLLTHAHIDHSGDLPLLYKNGFRGTVYTTSATTMLADIMLRDSANIQMQDAEWKTRKEQRAGHGPVEPKYTVQDVEGLMKLFRPCEYGEMVQINEHIHVRFNDAGHLLGSANIEVWLKEGQTERKVLFSGDVGNKHQPILRNPTPVDEADYVVIESTYGDRLHEEVKDIVHPLAEYLQKTFDRGGNVVIPAFAVGRTQEMLYFLRQIKEEGLVKGHPDFPVYVDSPLADNSTSVFLQCDRSYLDEESQYIMDLGVNPLVFPGLNISQTVDESRAINFDPTPKVIISASGMCDAGRIRHHLKHNLWRKESTVLFVGFQAEGTLGRRLLDGEDHVKIFGEEIAVNAEIGWLPGMSGHADRDGLLEWIGAMKTPPKAVFVNHGEDQVCNTFADTLKHRLGFEAYAPYSGTCFDLARDEFDLVTEGVPITKAVKVPTKSLRVLGDLIAATERLLALVKTLGGRSNRELRGYTDKINALIDKINE